MKRRIFDAPLSFFALVLVASAAVQVIQSVDGVAIQNLAALVVGIALALAYIVGHREGGRS